MQCCSVFLCGIPENKIPHWGIAVISNPTVCDVCVFKRTVFGENEIICGVAIPAVSPQFTRRPCGMENGFCDVFVVCKIVEVMTLIVLQDILSYADVFPFLPH